uniref:Uncharacterized protein n=1 Tax=Arundo donax TaxID=35708 RepID=A0A0A9G339_ARUDO
MTGWTISKSISYKNLKKTCFMNYCVLLVALLEPILIEVNFQIFLSKPNLLVQ